MARPKNDRVGECFITKEELGGYKIIIVEYNNYNDVVVEFQDEYKAKKRDTYQHCKQGVIANPYHPSVFGVGFVGEGNYLASVNNEITKHYNYWYFILQRGCDENFKEKHPSYKDVTVNKEIYDFQKFGEWLDNNWYEVEGERMHIDKDILIKGNKEYRFDRMILVPQRINTLFVKNDSRRGKYPIGVYYNKECNKFQASCRILNNSGKQIKKNLGLYNTPEETFQAYKIFKEQYIKEVADEYKNLIPQDLYEAMYRWKVEITD